jgi:hypothetical protein
MQVANPIQILPGSLHDPVGHKTFQEVVREYEALSDQLSNLDRYLAIHTWDIDAVAKKVLVDQRVELVLKLDSVRRSKEHLAAALQTSSGLGKTAQSPSLGQQINTAQSQSRSGQFPDSAGYQGTSWVPGVTPTSNLFHCSLDNTEGLLAPVGTPCTDTFNSIFSSQTAMAPLPVPGSMNMGCDMWPSKAGVEDNAHWDQDWVVNPNLGANSNFGVFEEVSPRTVGSEVEADITGNNDGWRTPTDAAPPEISRVYHTIHDAARRGELLESHLEELALVTAKLGVPKSNERDEVTTQQPRSSLNNNLMERQSSTGFRRVTEDVANGNSNYTPSQTIHSQAAVKGGG